MRKLLVLFVILIIAVMTACSKDKSVVDDSVNSDVNEVVTQGSEEDNHESDEKEVKVKRTKREKTASLEEEYGEVEIIKERIGPVTSITVPEGAIVFEGDGSDREGGENRISIQFDDADFKKYTNTDRLNIGAAVLEVYVSFEQEMSGLESMLTIGDHKLNPEFHKILKEFPELSDYDEYYLSIDDEKRQYYLSKVSEDGEYYFGLSFTLPNQVFSEEKLAAIHDIILSMEYEL